MVIGRKTCPECGNRTRTTERYTISSPTYTRSGSAQVTEDCAHRSYHTSRTVTLPKKQRPKPSSASGFFGGRRSVGGGAGSSW